MSKHMSAYRWFGRGWLSAGYVFLYIPILMLVVFSFNSSRLDMLWSGEKIGVVVDGIRVLLVNVGGAVRAYEDRCLHQGARRFHRRIDLFGIRGSLQRSLPNASRRFPNGRRKWISRRAYRSPNPNRQRQPNWPMLDS